MNDWRVNTLLFLLLAFPTAVRSQTGQGSPLLPQRALELQQEGNYAAAADAYRAYLKDHPDDPDALSNLGVVLTRLGEYDQAIEEYKAAERLRPGDWRIALNLALAYLKGGHLHEAAEKLEALHSQVPQVKQISYLLADCELQLGENDRVIALLQPMERDDPSDLATAYMLGTALIRERRIQEGEVLLDRIMRNGDSPEARFLLGTQYYESGDYPAAVKELASAIELNDKLPGLESYYGLALLQTGDPQAAAAAFRKELAQNPNDYPSSLSLGQILTVAGKFHEAMPLLEHALTLRPGSADALLAYGECLAGIGNFAEAREKLEIVARAVPDSLAVHRDLASVYTRLHLPSKAAQEQAVVNRLERMTARSSTLAVKDLAPDFDLQEVNSQKKVSLHEFRQKSPVVLVFGSYTCPEFRDSADALKALYGRYGRRLPFFLVYIREAHAANNWQSTQNEREGVSLPPARTMVEKRDHAVMCTRKLHLPFTALVDGMDGRVEKAYSAWPSHVFVIGMDGRILYTSGLSQQDFQPKDLEKALNNAVAEKTGSKRVAAYP